MDKMLVQFVKEVDEVRKENPECPATQTALPLQFLKDNLMTIANRYPKMTWIFNGQDNVIVIITNPNYKDENE